MDLIESKHVLRDDEQAFLRVTFRAHRLFGLWWSGYGVFRSYDRLIARWNHIVDTGDRR